MKNEEVVERIIRLETKMNILTGGITAPVSIFLVILHTIFK